MVSAVFWIQLALYSFMIVVAASVGMEVTMGTLGTLVGKIVIGALMFLFAFSVGQTGLTFFRASMLWNAYATARSRSRRGEDVPRLAFPKSYDVVISLILSLLVVVVLLVNLH